LSRLPELRVIRQRDKLSGRATSPQTAAQVIRRNFKPFPDQHELCGGITSYPAQNQVGWPKYKSFADYYKPLRWNTSCTPVL